MKPTYSPFAVQPTIPRGRLVNLVGGAMCGKLTASPDLYIEWNKTHIATSLVGGAFRVTPSTPSMAESQSYH